MTNANMEKRITELKELKIAIKALESEASEIEHEIKNEMTSKGVDEYVIGIHTVRYKEVTSNRFDSKAFKADFEDIYKEYCKPSKSMRFTVA